VVPGAELVVHACDAFEFTRVIGVDSGICCGVLDSQCAIKRRLNSPIIHDSLGTGLEMSLLSNGDVKIAEDTGFWVRIGQD
jgi:hypothetical protein